MVYKSDGKYINTEDLLTAYKVVTDIMKDHQLNSDSSWRHVQCWISNKICDQLKTEDIIINGNLVKSK